MSKDLDALLEICLLNVHGTIQYYYWDILLFHEPKTINSHLHFDYLTNT